MDSESRSATKVLAAIAESNHSKMAMVHRFQAMPEVEKVSFEFDSYRNDAHCEFGGGPAYVFDWYVDVLLKNGNAIWWTLDVQWDEANWSIESSVELPGEYGPSTLKKFPDRVAETIDEFIIQLKEATSQLLESADLIDSQI